MGRGPRPQAHPRRGDGLRDGPAGLGGRLLKAALAALAAFAIAAPAFAQGPGSVPPPPVRQAVDEQGVDVIRGEFNAGQPAVSIGPAYPHGLVYSSVNAGSGWFNGVWRRRARRGPGSGGPSIGTTQWGICARTRG